MYKKNSKINGVNSTSVLCKIGKPKTYKKSVNNLILINSYNIISYSLCINHKLCSVPPIYCLIFVCVMK